MALQLIWNFLQINKAWPWRINFRFLFQEIKKPLDFSSGFFVAASAKAGGQVELQGIEPWSREDERVRSTCLVDFHCRESQGGQQPKKFRSCCFLDIVAQHNEAQSMLSTPLIHTR